MRHLQTPECKWGESSITSLISDIVPCLAPSLHWAPWASISLDAHHSSQTAGRDGLPSQAGPHPDPDGGRGCLQLTSTSWLLGCDWFQLPPGFPQSPPHPGCPCLARPPHDFICDPPPPNAHPILSRWAASNWPSKILGQIEMVQQQHTEDEEKFHKIQIMDQNNFQEKLEGLQVGLVQGSATPHSPPCALGPGLASGMQQGLWGYLVGELVGG